MKQSRPSRSQVRLWILLCAAFIIVGVASGICILKVTTEQFTRDTKNELLKTARLMALNVDIEAHENLKAPEDMEGEAYKRLVETLAKAQQQVPDIRFVYTLRKLPDGTFAFVLDATAPGDHDGDGIDDKSYLLDPYPEISPYAKRVFETGMATPEPTFVADRWGSFWSAYAPLINKKGEVVGVLGVDREASEVAKQLSDLQRAGWLGLGLVTLLSLGFASILARSVHRRGRRLEDVNALPHTGRTLRMAILELTLTGLSLSVLFVGINSYLAQSSLRNSLSAVGQSRDGLDSLEDRIQRQLTLPTIDPQFLPRVTEDARSQNLGWLAASLENLKVDEYPSWQQAFRRILADCSLEQNRLRVERDRINERIAAHNQIFSLAFAIATMLGIGSLVFVRSAVRQHNDLVRAQEDSQRHQSAYYQVADNLPIGLYMLRNNAIVYSNATWDEQVFRQKGEEQLDAFVRALHPEDRDSLVTTLLEAAYSDSTIDLQYRLVRHDGTIRTMESRAVPVMNADGELDHLLGFVIDVTSRVEAQRGLQMKNEEVEAKNVMLQRAVDDLEENFEAMVIALVKAVEAKDPYTAGHSERVMGYSVRIGEMMGLSQSELRVLQVGTLIHDVGKIGIPDHVLTKPSRLTDEEYAIIREHPGIGARMVDKIPVFRECIPIILWHHERLDGRGYPDGLSGDEIPSLVRIAAVADVFDAMTSTRAYRRAMDPAKALEELRREAVKGALDPNVVEVLADIVEREGILWNPPFEQAA